MYIQHFILPVFILFVPRILRCNGSNGHREPDYGRLNGNELDRKASVCLPCRFLQDRSNFRFKHIHNNRPPPPLQRKTECLGPMRHRGVLNNCISQLCIKYSVMSTNWTQHARQMVVDYVESHTPGCRISMDDPTMDETNISVCYCGGDGDDVNADDQDHHHHHHHHHHSRLEMEMEEDDHNAREKMISALNSKFQFPILKPSKLIQSETQTKNDDPVTRVCKMKESNWEVSINYGEKILGFEMVLSLPFFDSSVTSTRSSVTFKSPSCILNRK